MNKWMYGHLSAFMTIFIWGTTFISTKILLTSLTPIEIFFNWLCDSMACLSTTYIIKTKTT
mgnify:CR=1 FL=1